MALAGARLAVAAVLVPVARELGAGAGVAVTLPRAGKGGNSVGRLCGNTPSHAVNWIGRLQGCGRHVVNMPVWLASFARAGGWH